MMRLLRRLAMTIQLSVAITIPSRPPILLVVHGFSAVLIDSLVVLISICYVEMMRLLRRLAMTIQLSLAMTFTRLTYREKSF
jgi:hypothetical protein